MNEELSIHTGVTSLDVSDGTTMSAYIARPEAHGIFPGLIVFQEAFGVNAHIRDITDRFAREGFVAIAPELFHRTAPGFEADYVEKIGVSKNMGALTDEGLLADATAAYEWLQASGLVSEDNISAIGFCMGGRTAYLANTELPLTSAISFYGGGIAPSLLPLASKLHGQMLFFWGGRDAHIPATAREEVANALSIASKDFVNVDVSFADHGFFCDARASYSKRGAQLAWPLVLEFLSRDTV